MDVPEDVELLAVMATWDTLPEAIRAGIVAMVRAATPSGQPAKERRAVRG
jgi:hypothetical protein